MQEKKQQNIDLSRNLLLYYSAIGVIILGYIFLSIGSANSFTSITLGPIILVIGYIVAVPIALLSGIYHKKGEERPADRQDTASPTGRE